MYVPGLPDEQHDALLERMQRPDGSVYLRCKAADLFERGEHRLVLLVVPAGKQIFVLERDRDQRIWLYHSSPGTGTRAAAANLTAVKGANVVEIAFVWSPDDLRLILADATGRAPAVGVDGQRSSRQLRVDVDGRLYDLDGGDFELADIRVFMGDDAKLKPTAFDAWRETADAVRLLLSGEANGEPGFPTVKSNLTLVVLVTGFETYCEERFSELEGEGIESNFDRLAPKFLSREERESGYADLLIDRAVRQGTTPTALLTQEGRINFQQYDRSKTAFNRAYGIRFGELNGVSSQDLEKIQQVIRYRHRVVHESPKIRWLNQPDWSDGLPKVFADPRLAHDALQVFDGFIRALHNATLQLRPDSSDEPFVWKAED